MTERPITVNGFAVDDDGYLLIKDKQREVLGVFYIEKKYDTSIVSGSIYKKLDEAFGCHDWIPSVITKAEFETYIAFGIKEYMI